MSAAKPVTPRFYFDADVLGLARLLAQERADFTYPGDLGGRIKKRERPPCIITTTAAPDTEWIPAVAARGWVIVTRDKAIQSNRAEIDAVKAHAAKMVNLASADAVNTWAQLEVFMARWRDIEPLADETGPFIYSASRSRLRSIDLD